MDFIWESTFICWMPMTIWNVTGKRDAIIRF